jgi:DNA-directed RNA polymerase specialized sigma24 family protein
LPWVTRIAHNLVIDHFRREKRAPMVSNGDDFDIFEVLGNYDESTEDKMVREQTHKDLKALIQLFHPNKRKFYYAPFWRYEL